MGVSATEFNALKGALLPELQEHIRLLSHHSAQLDRQGHSLEGITSAKREHSVVLHEHSAILQEHSAILNEHSVILREHSGILNEHSAILREHSALLRNHGERLARLETRTESLERTVDQGFRLLSDRMDQSFRLLSDRISDLRSNRRTCGAGRRQSPTTRQGN